MKTQLLTLTSDECDKLLRYLQQPQDSWIPNCLYHRNYTMAVVMLDTGCRVGELVQLRQDQFWFSDAPVFALHIENTQAKNKHERTIPTTVRLRDAIEQLHRQWWCKSTVFATPYAFFSYDPRTPLTTRHVHRIIKSAGIIAIGREVHPHLLRHTFGSRLMRKTSLRVVQELLGHTNVSSTQIYTHPNNEDRQKAIDSLNDKE